MFFSDGYLHALVDEATVPSPPTTKNPLRLQQFISKAFRSELNIAENGAGYFINNAPKASAHHALFHRVVMLNGAVCKQGHSILPNIELKHGDLVSLQIVESECDDELIAWKGSKDVARHVEGDKVQKEERQGRMGNSINADTISRISDVSLSECNMIQYYREKLSGIWIPDIHEKAIMRQLPLTLRALSPSTQLERELTEYGFRKVIEEDFSIVCTNYDDVRGAGSELGTSIMQELINNTWVQSDTSCTVEKKLGIFLSEARISNEILQQELTSMIPVSILSSHLKRQNISAKTNVQFLDMCSAPGSKTIQLLSTLDTIMSKETNAETDYTIVANELNQNRAHSLKQRLHQQSGSNSLKNLLITCADGCDYAAMDQNSFDYIICDVPCSGDGTIRKSPKILNKWSPKNAAKNKPLQMQLLKVGLGLLKPVSAEGTESSGFLLYSTCSLNPMENEEVISEVINELNEDTTHAYEYAVVDLSKDEVTSTSRVGNFLRILPAAAHGGFFVAAIRKLPRSGNAVIIHAQTNRCKNNNKDNSSLITRQVDTEENEATITYCISPCTQQLCAKITEKMGASTIISNGVAIVYNSDKIGPHILSQGCPYMCLLKQFQDANHVRLSHAEFIIHLGKMPTYRALILPIDGLLGTDRLDTDKPLIIEVVRSPDASSGSDQSFLLPAKVLRVIHGPDIDLDDDIELALVTIEARPQVYRRAIIDTKTRKLGAFANMKQSPSKT